MFVGEQPEPSGALLPQAVTLALTHHERFEMLCESIAQVEDDPRITEIVIVDDASTGREWDLMNLRWGNTPKVKLYRNERNIDCYFNKAEAVRKSSSPWVILLDSDNVLDPRYIDALWTQRPWRTRTAYLPTFAQPNFDYRAFSGMWFDRTNVGEFVGKEMFTTALNTANHFFYRDEYLRVWDEDTNPHIADSIYQNYRWLEFGNDLYFVPGMEYFHRVHPDSHYMRNHNNVYEEFRLAIEDRLREMS